MANWFYRPFTDGMTYVPYVPKVPTIDADIIYFRKPEGAGYFSGTRGKPSDFLLYEAQVASYGRTVAHDQETLQAAFDRGFSVASYLSI